MSRPRSLATRRVLCIVAPVAALAVATTPAVAAPARAGGPAGNNGTVKITPVGEEDGVPQNTPHVPCAFDIEWYGFDQGDDIVSTVTFTMQAPTADVALATGPQEVHLGGDSDGGSAGLNAEATFELGLSGEPDPQQGYHVKVTVNTTGSQGADTKHKTFWVSGCDDTPPPPPNI